MAERHACFFRCRANRFQIKFINFDQMFSSDVRKKLENIINGTIIPQQTDTCTAIRNKLCRSFPTSTTVKKEFESKQRIKEEQVGYLKSLTDSLGLCFKEIPDNLTYLTHGGEAKIYLDADGRHVIKLNDAIYYATWLEFLNSIVIHNLLFPDTSYQLLGFLYKEETFLAVLKQPFVAAEGTADLHAIRELLEFNGFRHIKRQDYFNEEFGLILEDMHDENVILNDGSLFFIDTVFYVVK
jgi:hypothetical protein